MRSMLVIGLGRFGTHLAKNLIQLNNEVMVVDKDEESVSRLEPYVTQLRLGTVPTGRCCRRWEWEISTSVSSVSAMISSLHWRSPAF